MVRLSLRWVHHRESRMCPGKLHSNCAGTANEDVEASRLTRRQSDPLTDYVLELIGLQGEMWRLMAAWSDGPSALRRLRRACADGGCGRWSHRRWDALGIGYDALTAIWSDTGGNDRLQLQWRRAEGRRCLVLATKPTELLRLTHQASSAESSIMRPSSSVKCRRRLIIKLIRYNHWWFDNVDYSSNRFIVSMDRARKKSSKSETPIPDPLCSIACGPAWIIRWYLWRSWRNPDITITSGLLHWW